jgi:hypothetical protein
MVGKRTWATANDAAHENGSANHRKPKRKLKDSPGPRNEQPRLFQFTDAADLALEEQRRDELKDRLLKAVDRENLEKFRKSDDEVHTILR